MKLCVALGISSGEVVAFAGAGGKSSAILAAAGEFKEGGARVLVVPTTKMFLSEAEKVGPIVVYGDAEGLSAKVKESFAGSGAVVAGSEFLSGKRISGVEPAWISRLAGLADVVLVEADGARRRPLKGTASHEPALPDAATLVVAVGNIAAFGKTVSEEHVHRPEAFARLTGVGPGQSISARAFALALARGSLRDVPNKARTAALITGVSPESMADAATIARELWRLGVKKVVLSSIPREFRGQIWTL